MVSSTPTRRRPGGRSARVRAAVLEAALDELAERGYAHMSMAGVADRAGVNKTTVYRWWPTKGALLAAALLPDADEEQPPAPRGDIRTDLLLLWTTAPTPPNSQNLGRSVAVARQLVAASSDPVIADVHGRLWKRRLDLMRSIVDAAIATGQAPPDCDPELLMDLLFGPVYSRVIARQQAASARFLQQVMASALAAVGVPNAPDLSRPEAGPHR